MDDPVKLTVQYTGRRGNSEWTIQWNWQYNTQDEGAIPNGRSSEPDSTIRRTKGQSRMDNPVKLTVQYTGRRAIPNGRSSETDSTIHRTKGQSRMDDPVKLTVQYTGRRGNPEWTIQWNWQYNTQDEGEKTQRRKLKRWTTQTPPKTGGELRLREGQSVPVSFTTPAMLLI
jgi:hypothetical protein